MPSAICPISLVAATLHLVMNREIGESEEDRPRDDEILAFHHAIRAADAEKLEFVGEKVCGECYSRISFTSLLLYASTFVSHLRDLSLSLQTRNSSAQGPFLDLKSSPCALIARGAQSWIHLEYVNSIEME